MKTTSEYHRRILDFLANFIDINNCRGQYSDEEIIKYTISILINQGILSPTDLQKEALRISDVLIPLSFINECAAI